MEWFASRRLMISHRSYPPYSQGCRGHLNPFKGSEQGGTRPVLVLQNNTGNLFCPTLIVAPLTTQVNKKKDQPTHYLLSGVRGLPEDSVALLEQIKTIDKSRIITVAADCKQSETPDQSETSD